MNLGIMGNSLRPMIQQGMIYGYDIAANELMDYIFKISGSQRISCIYEPGSFQQAILERKIRKVMKTVPGKEIQMLSEYDLLFGATESIEELDVIHNVSSEFIPMIGLREYIKKPIPVTWTIHCASYPALLSSMFLAMTSEGIKSYDTMICTSSAVMQAVQHILERVEAYSGKKSKVNLVKIPLGVDTSTYRPCEKYLIREKYGIPQDAFVLFWLGRFSPGDKADLFPLLLTFSRLVKKNPKKKLLLLLAGYQPQGTNYIEILEQSAQMLGIRNKVVILNNHDVSKRYELYNISDVFTSPIDNVQETFGITPIEAMACGIPQVVSDWDGYKDTVQDGITGFKVKTMWCSCLNDLKVKGFLPFDMAHRTQMHHYLVSRSVAVDIENYEVAIQHLIDNPELRHRMSDSSRKRAVMFYDWKKVISEMDSLWSDLMDCAKKSNETFYEQSFLLPDYCMDFRDYPTAFVDEETQFFTTEFAESIPLQSLPAPYGVETLMSNTQLQQIIIGMKKCTMQSIKAEYPEYTDDQVKRTIMYLYKNGMLRTRMPYEI